MVEEATSNLSEVTIKFAEDSQSQVGIIRSAHQGIFSSTDRDMNTPYIRNIRVVTTIAYLQVN